MRDEVGSVGQCAIRSICMPKERAASVYGATGRCFVRRKQDSECTYINDAMVKCPMMAALRLGPPAFHELKEGPRPYTHHRSGFDCSPHFGMPVAGVHLNSPKHDQDHTIINTRLRPAPP